MSSIPLGANQWQLVSEYVKKHQCEAGEEALSPREVAVFLRRRGLSEGQISKTLNKAPSTVHLWVAEEKKVEQQVASSK